MRGRSSRAARARPRGRWTPCATPVCVSVSTRRRPASSWWRSSTPSDGRGPLTGLGRRPWPRRTGGQDGGGGGGGGGEGGRAGGALGGVVGCERLGGGGGGTLRPGVPPGVFRVPEGPAGGGGGTAPGREAREPVLIGCVAISRTFSTEPTAM